MPEPHVESLAVTSAPAARAAVGLARLLRDAGLRVPTGSTVMFGDALAQVGWAYAEDVYWAARATLCRRPEEIALFDA